MATNNLQSVIASTPNSSDLSALGANETFRAVVDAELAAKANAAAAAAAHNDRIEDVASGVQTFSSAMSAVRNLGKRFPECVAFTNEAAKQIQLAMGVVHYNVPKTPAPAPTTAATAPAPIGTATATGKPVYPQVLPAVTPTTPTPTAGSHPQFGRPPVTSLR